MKRHFIKFFYITLVLVITAGTSLFSQNSNKVTPDPRLYQCFEKTYIDNLLVNNPEMIAYYNYYLDHSYYVASLKAEKEVTGKDIHNVEKKSKDGNITNVKFSETKYNAKTFNVLKYNFETGYLLAPNYIWKEAGIVIVFYPEKSIKEEFIKFNKNK